MTPHLQQLKKLQRGAVRKKWETMFAMHLRAYGFPEWEAQFRFDPNRRWSADFAWPQHKILVELEGGIWRRGGGAHSHPMNILRDIEKGNGAAILGYRVFRFFGDDVKSLKAVLTLVKIFNTFGIPLVNKTLV